MIGEIEMIGSKKTMALILFGILSSVFIAGTFCFGEAKLRPRMKLTIDKTEILDNHKVYGSIGTYEKLTGTIWGEVDPKDPKNQLIVDLDLAPVNQQGMVEYKADFVMLKPTNMSKSNGILRYDAPNRGNMLTMPADPVLLKRGYVILYGAWQGDVPKSNPDRLTLTVPIAKNHDGSSIIGIYRTELLPMGPVAEMPLPGGLYNGSMIPYAPASLDNAGLEYSLTKRLNEADPRALIPKSDWKFATSNATDNPFPGKPDPTKVSLKDGFDPNYLYELTYLAKDPKVMGLGLAVVRDYVSFFHKQAKDSFGTPNPVAYKIRFTIGTGISQCGNFMKTFIHLGFNQALDGCKVFDGIYAQVAARQTQVNARFAVPGGGGGIWNDHTSFGQTAPRGFAADYEDSLTGRRGGILKRATATDTVPKIFLGFSGTEFWVLQGSPVLTDAFGAKDLVQPKNVRIYSYASTQHGGPAGATWAPKASIYPAGVMNQHNDTFRALFFDLVDWVTKGIMPPESQTPKISNGTLVKPDKLVFPVMKGLSWPVNGTQTPIPEFKYLGWYNNWSLLDFGLRYRAQDDSGIAEYLPPHNMSKEYAIMVPQVDKDGLEIAGIRTVDIQAPLGTSLSFNYTAVPGRKDLFWLSGAYIPFHKTKAERLAAGDTRLSLEERYGSQEGYVKAVTAAAEKLVFQRFLLQEDADAIIAKAKANPILP
jgi:hypothetical protein